MTTASADTQFVTLGIDRELFAVPVAAVVEILDMRPMARVPNAPGYVLGLIDVRGRSVPVMDLRAKLGFPGVAATENTRILVLELGIADRRIVLGLVADRVIEVTALSDQGMEPPPDIGVDWRSDYIAGIGRRGGDLVIVFDMSKLFSADDVAFIGRRAPETETPVTNAA